MDIMDNMDINCEAYKDKDPRQVLRYLLRLIETKLNLVWRFETGEEITSLCIAHYVKNWEFRKQVVIGSKDSCVYALSIDKKLLWKFQAEDEILSLFATDLTNEGSEEIVVASRDHNIYILSPEGQLLWKHTCEGPLKAVTTAQGEVDKFIVAGSSNGYIYFIKFHNGVEWKYYCGDNCIVNGLCTSFIGENGRDNIIAVTNQGDVIILDYQDKKLWRRFKKPGSLYAVIAQDIDNDGINEIMICSDACCVYTLNSSGREKWRFKTTDSVYSIHCCDIDIDNRLEIIIGTKNDFVYVLNADGQYKWKYKTDHNVWSIYSAPLSHPKFYDLFAGLSNRMVYYYKLLDGRLFANKIEQAYNKLLDDGKPEWDILQGLGKDKDKYLRRFAAQKVASMANDPTFVLNTFSCLKNMLEDPSPVVRSSVVDNLVNLYMHYPELVLRILSVQFNEHDESVRYRIIEGLSNIALNMPNKRAEIFSHLQNLNHQWEQIDRKTITNLVDIAQNELITGNLKKAMMDFQLLAKRGVDIIWKHKTDGFVCTLACGELSPEAPPIIILASRDNHLYVFDHRGRLKWEEFTQTYTQRVFIEDLNQDGQPEIIIGGANGTFQFFSEEGKEKGGFIINSQVNDFCLIRNQKENRVDLVIGGQEGAVYYLDPWGRQEWIFLTKTCVLSVYAEDLNLDGRAEVAVGTLHGRLFLLDQTGNLIWEKDFQQDIRTISSLRQPDKVYLIIGTRGGDIYALNQDGEIRWQYSCERVINQIRVEEIHDEIRVLIAGQYPSILMLDKDGNKAEEIDILGHATSFTCADINKDGEKEIILGSEDDNVYIYQFLDKQKIEKFVQKCIELSKISEKKLTFQRNDIIKLIKVNFESTDPKKKVVMVGYPGAGKSNLLWQIHSGELGEGYISVYINLQFTKLTSLADFLWDFSEKVAKDMCRKDICIQCPSRTEFTENYLDVFHGFFKEIVSRLDQKKSVILLDDFERLESEIAKGALSNDIFRIFEEMINTKKTFFIITTSTYNFYVDRKNEDEYGFLNDAMIKEVNFVDKFDAQRVLLQQLGDCLEDKERAVQEIITMTGCNAQFLQVAFNLIINHVRKTRKYFLSDEDWSELYIRTMESLGEELASFWEACQPWEKIVLSFLAEINLNGAMISDIENNLGIFTLLITSYQLGNVLKNLAQKSILNEIFTAQGIQYNFTIPVLRDWVKNKTNPFQVISKNASAVLSTIPLSSFYRQHRLIQAKNQTEVFLQTIGLELERWKVLVKLSQKWSKLMETKADQDSGGDKNGLVLNDFVRYLAKLLGFSVKEVLLSSKFTCFCFETPTIRIKKLANMILAVPNNRKPDEEDFQALMGLIANLDAASNVFMILELENSYLFEKLVSNSKLDLVLLNENDLKQIFLSQNYIRSLLDEVILKHVAFVDLSPYETMGPVNTMFFGRIEEIKTMRQLSHKNFAIVGSRQLGKTSLMLNVCNLLCHDLKIKTLYLDCSTYNDSISLCQAIVEGIEIGNGAVIDSLAEFKRVIRDWCKRSEVKVALFLDEIDTLLSLDKEQNEMLFKTFRSLSQENMITLVVAGYEDLFLRTKDIKSPLFNYLELIRLSALDKKAASQLITEPMKELGIHLQDEKKIVKDIFTITSCFPNLIQYICKRLIHIIASNRRRVIYTTDVSQVEKDPEFQDYLISRFFANLSPLGKVIILLVAEHQEISPYLIDEKLRENKISLLQQELFEEIDKIIMSCVFFKTEQGLRFSIPYFSQVMCQNMEKDLLLKQLLREVHYERARSL